LIKNYENGWPSVADQEGIVKCGSRFNSPYYQKTNLLCHKINLKVCFWHEGATLEAKVGQYNEGH